LLKPATPALANRESFFAFISYKGIKKEATVK